MQHYGLTLALRDAPALIARYKPEHRDAWPEVIRRLREIGITEMKIFLLGRRLFMYIEAVDTFDPARDFRKLTDDGGTATGTRSCARCRSACPRPVRASGGRRWRRSSTSTRPEVAPPGAREGMLQ